MREVKDTAKAVRRAFDPKLTSDPHILSKAIATWWLHEEPAPPPVLPLVHAPGARRASDTQSSPARAATPPAVMTATPSGVELNLVSRRLWPRYRPLAARAVGGCSSRRRSRQREPPARRDVSRKQDAAPHAPAPPKLDTLRPARSGLDPPVPAARTRALGPAPAEPRERSPR